MALLEGKTAGLIKLYIPSQVKLLMKNNVYNIEVKLQHHTC